MSAVPDLSDLLTIRDFERAARAALPAAMFDTLFGAVGAELWRTNTNNVEAFDALPLRPRVMTGVGARNLATTVLGQEISLPIIAAPTGSHQRVHADGEMATACGTALAGTAMILSSVSNFSLEEVGPSTDGPKWFQSYVFKDREMSADLIRRAEAAGFSAIVLTVDNISGRVEHNERARRNGYSFADEVRTSPTLQADRVLRNLQPYETPAHGRQPRFQRQGLGDAFDPTLSWADLDWVRSITPLPVVVKGIQTAEDAILAAQHGVDAVVISNHGGTSVETDGQVGSLTLLPEVNDAVGDSLEVYLDGGIRSGGDVLKALALGARAVLIGRAEVWGLAVAGAEGVARVFEILASELDATMGLCGVSDVRSVSRAIVGRFRGTILASGLERTAWLHWANTLNDQEFAAAKTRVLGAR